MIDPTAAAIEARNSERDQLRAEVARLERALVAAYTELETVKADRDATARGRDAVERDRDAEHGRAELLAQELRVARAEIDRLHKEKERS